MYVYDKNILIIGKPDDFCTLHYRPGGRKFPIMRIYLSLVLVCMMGTNALAQHNASPATDTTSHSTTQNHLNKHHPSARMNFGAGVSSLHSNGATSTMPTVVGIARLPKGFEVEVEGGYWRSAEERSNALILSLHREIKGPFGLTMGALVESKTLHNETESEVGLMFGPAYTLSIRKVAFTLVTGLAWTRGSDKNAFGVHTGAIIRTWR